MVMHNGEMEDNVLHIAFFASWMIFIDYEVNDESSLQNLVEMWVPIAS